MLLHFSFLLLLPFLVRADYAPISATCPTESTFVATGGDSKGLLRDNDFISEAEYEWLQDRDSKTKTNLISFLNSLNMSDYSDSGFDQFFNDSIVTPPKVGLAFSGGGYRALLVGAGEVSALDSRSSTDELAGLLDSSTYIASVSGGSLMLATLIFQNWTTVDAIVEDNEVWNMTEFPVSADLAAIQSLVTEITPRAKAGFEISLVDVFSRVVSNVMFTNLPDQGLDLLWSDIRNIDAFSNHEMPFPIMTSVGGEHTNMSDFVLNVFEINPFEFGSWSDGAAGFVDLEYLGTQLTDGSPVNSSSCYTNFDNAGLMVAYSSDFIAEYSSVLTGSGSATALSELGLDISPTLLSMFLSSLNKDTSEVLLGLVPNLYEDDPFGAEKTTLTDSDILRLTDSGNIGEGLPLDPLLVPSREISVIFAFDNSGNTDDNWPNGTSLYTTEKRIKTWSPNATFYDLPPTVDDFVAAGLNEKPSFFGCNGSSLITDTDDFSIMKPLLVYYPNIDISSISNTSSFVLSYDERDELIDNGFQIPTYLIDSDPEFAQCIGCAILKRSHERTGVEIGYQCSSCFTKYCYDGWSDDGNVVQEESNTDVFNSGSSLSAGSSDTSSVSGSGSNDSTATAPVSSETANAALGNYAFATSRSSLFTTFAAFVYLFV